MDLGSYAIQTLRQVFGCEPTECLSAHARLMPDGYDQDIDQAFTAAWKFPNGGIGRMHADSFYEGKYLQWLTRYIPPVRSPKLEVKHQEAVVPNLETGMETATTKTVIFWDVLAQSLWHRIDVVEDHELRSSATGEVKKWWTNTRYLKQYAEDKLGADDSWTTYRHMLEQFVNKIRGRQTGIWVDGEDSIRQMEMIDGAYTKAGMKIRPSIAPEDLY